MLTPSLIQFLKDLKANNNKEWFAANKERYEEQKRDFEQFVSLLIPELASFDESLKYLEPKKCIFRIYRDVRFSKDKEPYKVNFGAEFSKGGRRSNYASYYVHIEPGESFIGGGIYMPEPQILKAIRTEIYENTDEFLAILQDKKFSSIVGGLSEMEMLKTAPKDFPKDFNYIHLLRHKHYVVGVDIDDEETHGEALFNKTIEVFQAMKDFNAFLNRIIDNLE